jgi:predicted small secreted protein
MMKNKTMIRLAAVVLLAAFALPGCNFTSAQVTGLFQDLSSIGVNAIFETISASLNPDDNDNVQAVIDIGQDATQITIDNSINNYIPDDPKP